MESELLLSGISLDGPLECDDCGSPVCQSQPLCLLGGLSPLFLPLLRGHPSPALWLSIAMLEKGQPPLNPEKSSSESLLRPRLVLLLPAYDAESEAVLEFDELKLCASRCDGFD